MNLYDRDAAAETAKAYHKMHRTKALARQKAGDGAGDLDRLSRRTNESAGGRGVENSTWKSLVGELAKATGIEVGDESPSMQHLIAAWSNAFGASRTVDDVQRATLVQQLLHDLDAFENAINDDASGFECGRYLFGLGEIEKSFLAMKK